MKHTEVKAGWSDQGRLLAGRMKTTSPQFPFSVTPCNPQPYTARNPACHPLRSAPHGGNTRNDDHSELFALDVVQEVLLQRLQHGEGQGVPLPGVVQDNVSARQTPSASVKDEPLYGRGVSAFGSLRCSERTRRNFPPRPPPPEQRRSLAPCGPCAPRGTAPRRLTARPPPAAAASAPLLAPRCCRPRPGAGPRARSTATARRPPPSAPCGSLLTPSPALLTLQPRDFGRQRLRAQKAGS